MRPHKTDEPLVCICIPSYNAESTIRATIDSILSQTYKNILIKVVDNASTDRTLEILRAYSSSRLQIMSNASNLGGEGNFNRCIELCEGEYTAIFHADDVYAPNIIEKQVEFLALHRSVGAVLTEAINIDANAKVIGSITVPKAARSENCIYSFQSLFKAVLTHSNFLICPSALVRTEVYQHIIKTWQGERFASSADLDVWLRIAQHTSLAILPQPLMYYRTSDDQFSSLVKRQTERADIFKVLDYYLSQPFVQALITPVDLKNYENLEARDRVMRAVNLFLLDRSHEANALCFDIFSPRSLFAAINNKRGKLSLFCGAMIKFTTILRIEFVGKTIMNQFIRYYHK